MKDVNHPSAEYILFNLIFDFSRASGSMVGYHRGVK